jgi:hypothetical protein
VVEAEQAKGSAAVPFIEGPRGEAHVPVHREESAVPSAGS